MIWHYCHLQKLRLDLDMNQITVQGNQDYQQNAPHTFSVQTNIVLIALCAAISLREK